MVPTPFPKLGDELECFSHILWSLASPYAKSSIWYKKTWFKPTSTCFCRQLSIERFCLSCMSCSSCWMRLFFHAALRASQYLLTPLWFFGKTLSYNSQLFSMRPGESKETHRSHSASDSYKCVSGTHGRHWSQKEYLDVARELQRLVISIFNIEYRNTCCRKPKIGNSIIDATICTPTSGRKCPSCCGARILPWKKSAVELNGLWPGSRFQSPTQRKDVSGSGINFPSIICNNSSNLSQHLVWCKHYRKEYDQSIQQ